MAGDTGSIIATLANQYGNEDLKRNTMYGGLLDLQNQDRIKQLLQQQQQESQANIDSLNAQSGLHQAQMQMVPSQIQMNIANANAKLLEMQKTGIEINDKVRADAGQDIIAAIQSAKAAGNPSLVGKTLAMAVQAGIIPQEVLNHYGAASGPIAKMRALDNINTGLVNAVGHQQELEKTQMENQGKIDVANINAGATLGSANITANSNQAVASGNNYNATDTETLKNIENQVQILSNALTTPVQIRDQATVMRMSQQLQLLEQQRQSILAKQNSGRAVPQATPVANPKNVAPQASTSTPPIAALKEGHTTTFKNGQVWTLVGGKPKRIQ